MASFTEVRAYFEPSDFLRIMRALQALEKESAKLEKELPRRNAIDYQHLLHKNISSGANIPHVPYSERYAKWKRDYGLYQDVWQLNQYLLNAITFWKDDDNQWRAGIPAGVYDSGGTSWYGAGDRGAAKPIAMYAKVVEYGLWHGREGYKARPVFGPTKEEYAKEGYLKRGERALSQLGAKWT
ncbi:MAG: hypothetical protein ACXAEN_26095 [Candidatus Thorarchaeota archaeon]|jgi:hypothetical protein